MIESYGSGPGSGGVAGIGSGLTWFCLDFSRGVKRGSLQGIPLLCCPAFWAGFDEYCCVEVGSIFVLLSSNQKVMFWGKMKKRLPAKPLQLIAEKFIDRRRF